MSLIFILLIAFVIWLIANNRRKSQQKLANSFKDWLVEVAESENKSGLQGIQGNLQAFNAWVATLSEDDLIGLTKNVAGYCKNLNFELVWLLDERLDRDPDMKTKLGPTVIFYSLSYWEASQIQEDIQAFIRFSAWEESPKRKKNQDLSHKLYTKLRDERLISEITNDVLMAPEKERYAYIVSSINQVAEEDMPALKRVLKSILKPEAK